QAVPAGCHIRFNLQTGQNEAKLAEEEGLKQQMINKETSMFMAEDIKKALKKFKGFKDFSEKDQVKKSQRAQFRSMDELKKDMAALDIQVETDVQIITKLLYQLNNTNSTVDQKVTALLDLEYLVHQVDNAHNLVSMGGLILVTDTLNDTNDKLQESAAFVLGAAVSSNPSVQVMALKCGTLQKLLTLLATPQPLPIKKKVLFALACLLHHFPFAQRQFVKLGGLQVLHELFQTHGAETLHVRIITVLYDMITEKELVSQTGVDPVLDSNHQEILDQYGEVILLPMLVEQGWCSLVPEVLTYPDHDRREKALLTLLAMVSHCQLHYLQNPTLSILLSALHKQYQKMAFTEKTQGEEDGYFGEILVLVDSLLKML
ncbi:nucleotide exchange factor SIL1-like, partial [Trichomycterus rosablanca]